MAYAGSGRFPIERASKIGHVKIIEEPRVQRLLEAFERTEGNEQDAVGELTGNLDLNNYGDIQNVVAIDGSHLAIPNTFRDRKRIAFIPVLAPILKPSEFTALKEDPILDPRDLAKTLHDRFTPKVAVLPLSGVTIPGETVVHTIRKTCDDVLRYTDLYPALKFLISREWLNDYEMQEHMECYSCSREFVLPRSQLLFSCPHCAAPHTLGDYLRLSPSEPQDWATEEAAIGLRNIMETLLMFRLLILYSDRPAVLRRTLFVKDGPLLLRAQLSRLIEPIRAFLTHLRDNGTVFHLLGVEKSGDLVDHAPLIADVLNHPGDFFLPSVQYLHERIQGVPFVESSYRNRVQYGAKVVVRLGNHHVVALNVPSGEFLLSPQFEDLIGFEPAASVLSEMVSYSYENALIPLVLANSLASIAPRPSSDILEAFARRFLE